MCGRYAFMPADLEPGILATIRRINREANLSGGDVRPGDTPPAIVMENGAPAARLMRWGMPAPQGSKLVINARAESAQQKSMFSHLVARNRCLLPASLYYEWTRTAAHTRMKIRADRGLYMAGLFRPAAETDAGWEFVILTQAANSDILPLHDRMPLILPEKDQRRGWLRDESAARRILEMPPKLRLHVQADEPEQLDLFAAMEM